MQAASTQPHQTAGLTTAPQPEQPLPRPPYTANKNTTALTRPKNPVVSTPWSLRLPTHRRLAHSQEAQLTSCFRPLAHESTTRQRQYSTIVARAMSRSRVWCNFAAQNHHATGLDTHRSAPRHLKVSRSFPTAACRRRRVSCLLGVSHVLRGLGCRSAAEVTAAAPPAGALLCGSRQLIASVAECCGCVAMLSAGRRLCRHAKCWPQLAPGVAWLAAAAVAAVLATGLEVAGSVGCCKVAAAATGGRCSAAHQRTCPAQAAGIAVCDAIDTAPHGGLERVAVMTLLQHREASRIRQVSGAFRHAAAKKVAGMNTQLVGRWDSNAGFDSCTAVKRTGAYLGGTAGAAGGWCAWP